MGIFREIGKWVGEKIETTGDIFGWERVSQFGRTIQDLCAERVATERSYNKREANIYTTERLNEILISFSDGYKDKAVMIEKKVTKLVEDYYDEMISLLENDLALDYNKSNVKMLKRAKNRISNIISGGITEHMYKRMSLDDSECLSILKLDSGEEKKRKMSNFSDKVIKEALDNLCSKVRLTLSEQTEDIQHYLGGIIEEQENTISTLKTYFDKMVQDNFSNQRKRENGCVIPLYIVDVAECVIDTLN